MAIGSDYVAGRRLALVTTTINVPTALTGYIDQFRRGRPEELLVIVVGDKKTPPQTGAWLRQQEWSPATCIYLDPHDQERWLRKYPRLASSLPWNSVQRRNLGYLIAAEQAADRIITIDDDNFVSDDDFFAGHCITGSTVEFDEVSSTSGWFDIGFMLKTTPPIHVPPRGYLQSRRHQPPDFRLRKRRARIAVNAGLWLGEPDVDAVTRLVTPVAVVGPANKVPLPLALAKGTWCPFNSQNTSFAIDLLPFMYLIVMGTHYRGMRVGRYDDIWMSYFTKVATDHLGDAVMFGNPWVRQDRNQHNILEDIAGEVPGMILTERLMPILERLTLCESSYIDCYAELIEKLRSEFTDSTRHDGEDRRYWNDVLDRMSVWADTCRCITTNVR